MIHVATISSQRQITLPKKMLETLDIDVKSKLMITIDDHSKILVAQPITQSLTQQLAGSLTKHANSKKLGTSTTIAYKKAMQQFAASMESSGKEQKADQH